MERIDRPSGERVKYACAECVKVYSSKQCLKEHMYKHNNMKPYMCKICKKQFRHASQFTMHRKTHKSGALNAWPKLTDLLRSHQVYVEYECEESEKVHLPLINEPQKYILPSFSSINLSHLE